VHVKIKISNVISPFLLICLCNHINRT